MGFGESPLGGILYLRPSEGTSTWSYAVDIDEDGVANHQGALDGEIGLVYRFTTVGVHWIRVTLTGPGGTETINVPAVVNDPGAVQILAQRDVDGSDFDAIFEGIAINHAGTALFVGDFFHSRIYPLNAADLAQSGSPVTLRPGFFHEETMPGGAEGLSVTPSDSTLLVAHKYHGLSVVAIPSMEIRRSLRMAGEFFIDALDETTAVSTSREEAVLVDTRSGESIGSFALPESGHFSVHPTGRIAVLDRSNYSGKRPALQIVSMPGLEALARIPLPQLDYVSSVAFDPAGDRAYVMGSTKAQGAVFVLIDVLAARVLATMILGSKPCGWFCVANPVATLAGGRFVAMEQGDGVYFIDTELDFPRFHTTAGLSIAASPQENIVFLLKPDGVVTKARISR